MFEKWGWVTEEPTAAKARAGLIELPLFCACDATGWGVRDQNGWWLAAWDGRTMSEEEKERAVLLCHLKYNIPFEEK